MREFKYLGVLIMSEGKVEVEINRHLQQEYISNHCGEEGTEPQNKVPSSLFQSQWILLTSFSLDGSVVNISSSKGLNLPGQ